MGRIYIFAFMASLFHQASVRLRVTRELPNPGLFLIEGNGGNAESMAVPRLKIRP